MIKTNSAADWLLGSLTHTLPLTYPLSYPLTLLPSLLLSCPPPSYHLTLPPSYPFILFPTLPSYPPSHLFTLPPSPLTHSPSYPLTLLPSLFLPPPSLTHLVQHSVLFSSCSALECSYIYPDKRLRVDNAPKGNIITHHPPVRTFIHTFI